LAENIFMRSPLRGRIAVDNIVAALLIPKTVAGMERTITRIGAAHDSNPIHYVLRKFHRW
jgi:hypothetical protein